MGAAMAARLETSHNPHTLRITFFGGAISKGEASERYDDSSQKIFKGRGGAGSRITDSLVFICARSAAAGTNRLCLPDAPGCAIESDGEMSEVQYEAHRVESERFGRRFFHVSDASGCDVKPGGHVSEMQYEAG